MTVPDFIIIPGILLQDQEIKALDCHVYGIIHWLVGFKLQKCIASNKRIANYLGAKEGSVANSISRLAQKDYIKVILNDKRQRKEIIPLIRMQRHKRASSTNETGLHLQMKGVSSTNEHTSNSNISNNVVTKVTTTEVPEKPSFLSVSVSDVPGVAHTKPLTSYSKEIYSGLVAYMASKLGVRFPNYPKQLKYIKMLLQGGNSPETIKLMVDGALNDPYWKDKSPDFSTVYNRGQNFLPKKLTPQDAEKLEFANIFIKMVKGEDDWKKKANSWTPEKRRKLREFLNDQAAGKTNG